MYLPSDRDSFESDERAGVINGVKKSLDALQKSFKTDIKSVKVDVATEIGAMRKELEKLRQLQTKPC